MKLPNTQPFSNYSKCARYYLVQKKNKAIVQKALYELIYLKFECMASNTFNNPLTIFVRINCVAFFPCIA